MEGILGIGFLCSSPARMAKQINRRRQNHISAFGRDLVTEVLTDNEFFDFEAKYTPGAAEEITPARLPKDLFEKC